MKFESGQDFDQVRWDAFVSTHPAGHFMQSYAWGALQRHVGWEPLYCAVTDEGRLRATALVLSRTVPGLGRQVLYAPRGPVVDPDDIVALKQLLEGIENAALRPRGIFFRCDPYWTREQDSALRDESLKLRLVPRDWSSWNAPRFVFWLDLHGDEDVLMKKMSVGCRNDVKRGYKKGIVFSPGSASELGTFHRLMTATGDRKGIAYHDADYYRRLFDIVGKSANIQLFLGRHDEEVVTSGVSVAYGKKAWLLYAASDPAHYKLRANRAQQWEMIKWAHGLGCQRYDFRGTATNDPPSPKDPGYGVYEFKKSFGPVFTRLAGYYDLVQRDASYRLLRFSEDRLLPYAYRLRTLLK